MGSDGVKYTVANNEVKKNGKTVFEYEDKDDLVDFFERLGE